MSSWRKIAEGVAAGMRFAARRLTSRTGVWFWSLGFVVAVCVALIECSGGALVGANRSLHFAFSVVMPLLALLPILLVVRRSQFKDALWCIARHGISRSQLALGVCLLGSLMVALAMIVVVVAALAIVYHGRPGFWADLSTTVWIAALGAGSYVAWFGVGAGWFRYGWGLPLCLDFVLGSSDAWWAVLWPRAHLRNLLGGESIAGMSQAASSISLLVMFIVLLGVCGLQMGERGAWFRTSPSP